MIVSNRQRQEHNKLTIIWRKLKEAHEQSKSLWYVSTKNLEPDATLTKPYVIVIEDHDLITKMDENVNWMKVANL